jgi:hypothetical protein
MEKDRRTGACGKRTFAQELRTVIYLPNILTRKPALDEGTPADALAILNKVI